MLCTLTNDLLAANLVLEDTVERIYHGNAFAETWHGLFLIRGENVVLLGEIVRVLPVKAVAITLVVHHFIMPLPLPNTLRFVHLIIYGQHSSCDHDPSFALNWDTVSTETPSPPHIEKPFARAYVPCRLVFLTSSGQKDPQIRLHLV